MELYMQQSIFKARQNESLTHILERYERQRRAGKQLFKLMGAEHLSAEVGLPNARAWPSTVHEMGGACARGPRSGLQLRQKTSSVLSITLLIPYSPKLLPFGVTEVAAAERRDQEMTLEVSQLHHTRVYCRDGLNWEDHK